MSIYDEKPWLSLYDPDQPAEISLEFTDALSMFRASVSRNPDGDIIRYFGGRITARELDELSDAFAVALRDLGVGRGDRVALYLQNVPQFVIGMLATWKAGGVAVPVNPMYRSARARGGAERLRRPGAGLPGEPAPRRGRGVSSATPTSRPSSPPRNSTTAPATTSASSPASSGSTVKARTTWPC